MIELGTLIADLREAASSVDEAVDRVLAAEAEVMADEQRRNVPWHHRQIEQHITVTPDGPDYLVGPDAEGGGNFAHLAEFGTGQTPARPFVFPTGDQAEQRMPERIAEAIEKTW